MSTNDGGSAFPMVHQFTRNVSVEYDAEVHRLDATEYSPGMTLRDYFAAKAMQGLTANPHRDYNWNDAAELSFKIADAMLAEREKSK